MITWQALNLVFQQIYHKLIMVVSLIGISPASMMVYFTIQNVYVAVADRKQTLFLLHLTNFIAFTL